MHEPFDVERYRRQFPGLAREVAGRPAVFLDGPAGSQVPQAVVDAVSGYMIETNANSGGFFATSRETDAGLEEARGAVADLLGADEPDLIAFGANMTTLTISLSRALSRTWKPGDEVLVSRLDHDANFTPWVRAATDAGATAHEVHVRREDCTLDIDDLKSKLSDRTRLVAVGCASNAVGTINPVREIAGLAHAVGAHVFLDAVHYAPHAPMDVKDWDCDYVTCSAYKFFGPHVGMLWGRRELLETLPVDKLRPSSDAVPYRWETGTPNHEGIMGTMAAIDYLAAIGRDRGGAQLDRRSALLAAFRIIERYERGLLTRMLDGLARLPDIRVWGITDPNRFTERVPTVSITHARFTPDQIAARLGDQGIFVWHGNYYALPLTESLDLEPHGMVRIGLMHYNTTDEVDRCLRALSELA